MPPLLCPPDPPISRNEGVALFLEWAKRNPERLGGPAIEVLGRFFLAQFPCPK